MRVIAPKPPAERRTAIELTDREIALVHRGLTLDSPSSTEQRNLYDDQYKIFSEFDTLMTDLGIDGVTEG